MKRRPQSTRSTGSGLARPLPVGLGREWSCAFAIWVWCAGCVWVSAACPSPCGLGMAYVGVPVRVSGCACGCGVCGVGKSGRGDTDGVWTVGLLRVSRVGGSLVGETFTTFGSAQTAKPYCYSPRYHNPLSVSVTHGPLGVATHGSLGPGSGSRAARARPTALARPPPAVAPRDHSPGPRAASPNHECCMSDSSPTPPSPAAAADDGSLGAERVVPRGDVVPRTRQSPPPPPPLQPPPPLLQPPPPLPLQPPPPLPLKRPRSRAGRAADLAARDLSAAGMTWS